MSHTFTPVSEREVMALTFYLRVLSQQSEKFDAGITGAAHDANVYHKPLLVRFAQSTLE